MAITYALLDENASGSAATSYTTASKTPTANSLQLISITQYGAVGGVTVSGCSLTWVEVGHVDFDPISVPLQRITVLRALGASPTTGQLTITCPVGNLDVIYSWSEFAGTDTSGTNGSGAIIFSSYTGRSDSAASITLTLSALSDANNAVYGAWSVGTSGSTFTAGSGYTKASDRSEATQGIALATQYKIPGTTSPVMTWPSSAAIAGIGMEIKVAASGDTLMGQACL